MASISMAMPLTTASQKSLQSHSFFGVFVKPSKKVVPANSKFHARFQAEASSKEKAVAGLTAAALAASVVVPDVAEAATSGFTPSLNNFLLSIGAGGIVLFAIIGAVVGVSNFDPVKRG